MAIHSGEVLSRSWRVAKPAAADYTIMITRVSLVALSLISKSSQENICKQAVQLDKSCLHHKCFLRTLTEFIYLELNFSKHFKTVASTFNQFSHAFVRHHNFLSVIAFHFLRIIFISFNLNSLWSLTNNYISFITQVSFHLIFLQNTLWVFRIWMDNWRMGLAEAATQRCS